MAVGTSWHWVIQSVSFECRDVTPLVKVRSYLEISKLVGAVDVLVTHCGAGSVFWGLENRIPTIAMVNLSRPDDHQMDLGDYLDEKGLCFVTRNRIPSEAEILAARNSGPAVYKKIGVLDMAGLLLEATIK